MLRIDEDVKCSWISKLPIYLCRMSVADQGGINKWQRFIRHLNVRRIIVKHQVQVRELRILVTTWTSRSPMAKSTSHIIHMSRDLRIDRSALATLLENTLRLGNILVVMRNDNIGVQLFSTMAHVNAN